MQAAAAEGAANTAHDKLGLVDLCLKDVVALAGNGQGHIEELRQQLDALEDEGLHRLAACLADIKQLVGSGQRTLEILRLDCGTAPATVRDCLAKKVQQEELEKLGGCLDDIEKLAEAARSMKRGRVAQGGAPPRGDPEEEILMSDAVTPDDADAGTTLQWVQLVMAGGGMLGIAHVGFVYILEEAGLRFLGLGGTSAGAINASLIASVRNTPIEKSWQKTLDIMVDPEFSFASFEDGDDLFKKIHNASLTNLSLPSIARMAWTFFRNKAKFEGAWNSMGVNSGKKFHEWIEGQMKSNGITDQRSLDGKLKLRDNRVTVLKRDTPAGEPVTEWVKDINPGGDITDIVDPAHPLSEFKHPLKLVASEVSTQSQIVFPENWRLFWNVETMAHPADYVRASMSVPLFFEPFTVSNLPNANRVSEEWQRTCNYNGRVPSKATFLDGGILSNFPIDLFHNWKCVPLLPTLGLQLGPDRVDPTTVKDPAQLLSAMMSTSRHLSDREFLHHNPDYNELMTFVDTTGFQWLNFSMTLSEQLQLFQRGAKAALEFLDGWREKNGKWVRYKKLREQQIWIQQSILRATTDQIEFDDEEDKEDEEDEEDEEEDEEEKAGEEQGHEVETDSRTPQAAQARRSLAFTPGVEPMSAVSSD